MKADVMIRQPAQKLRNRTVGLKMQFQPDHRRYKPQTGFNAANRWISLQDPNAGSTSTSTSPLLSSISKKSPHVMNSASLATTIDDMPMDSENGSLAPPNSTNTSEEQAIAYGGNMGCRLLGDEKIVPMLKYNKWGNEFSLGFR